MEIGKHINNFVHSILHRKHHEWSYEGQCGPQTWKNHFSDAKGEHQSPINIDTSQAIFEPNFLKNPFTVQYNDQSCIQIKNTGFTFQVDGYKQNLSKVSGGPVSNFYSFLQFHMHWGDSIERGSEHLVDGHPYAAEIHFVNWNHEKFKSPKQASVSNKNDGLLVIAVFVKLGEKNEEFEKLTQYIHDIHLKNHHVPIQNFNMNKLLPKNTEHYWTYPGSLTTPPCSESVQWVVFKEAIEMSAEQLDKCHNLYHVTKEKLCNEKTSIRYNDRPICSMGDRVVLKTFE